MDFHLALTGKFKDMSLSTSPSKHHSDVDSPGWQTPIFMAAMTFHPCSDLICRTSWGVFRVFPGPIGGIVVSFQALRKGQFQEMPGVSGHAPWNSEGVSQLASR